MLFRIMIPLLILLLLPAFCIERISLRHRAKRRIRLLWYLPNIILAVTVMLTAIFESYTPAADRWKGTLLSIVLCLVVAETLCALLLIPTALLRRRFRRAAHATEWLAWGCGSALLFTMAYGFTYGYRRIHTDTFVYVSPTLPAAFDGYRIVQLSDLHLGTLHGRAEVVDSIVAEVNRQEPDLVVFTGDLVNYRADEAQEFIEPLRRIRSKDGVISIMGNHDYAQYFRHASPTDSLNDIRRLQAHQRAMGWDLLLNDRRIIRRGTDSIVVAGVENEGRPPFPALADLPRALRGIHPDAFTVLLSHDPTHWRRSIAGKTAIHLTLSGHTHGMQFKIGDFSPASWFYDEWGGDYHTANGQALYVSLGTGEVMIPFRLGAWPEISVITLKHKQK